MNKENKNLYVLILYEQVKNIKSLYFIHLKYLRLKKSDFNSYEIQICKTCKYFDLYQVQLEPFVENKL